MIRPRLKRLIRERLIGALCGAGGVIGYLLLHGHMVEQDYRAALAAQASAEAAQQRAIAAYQLSQRAERDARHQRYLAEASLRLQEAQKGDWR